MVVVRMPPPIGSISPQHLTLKRATELIRIFDPTRYGATATGFRNYGPISRFDHHREYPNKIDPDRSVIYAGWTLSCCLVEIFGDGGVIEVKQQQIAYITLKQSLKLLDLRASGAMAAGTVAAISGITQREISQAWGKYFYEHPELYNTIDGLIFSGAHNSEYAMILYERAKPKIESAKVEILNLNHPDLLEPILEIAEVHGLIVKI
jgi:hypothetical protein